MLVLGENRLIGQFCDVSTGQGKMQLQSHSVFLFQASVGSAVCAWALVVKGKAT